MGVLSFLAVGDLGEPLWTDLLLQGLQGCYRGVFTDSPFKIKGFWGRNGCYRVSTPYTVTQQP